MEKIRLGAKNYIEAYISQWVGPLVAGIVLVIIGLALFLQSQPASQRKKARLRLPVKTVSPVAAKNAGALNVDPVTQQTGQSLIF